MNEPLSQHTALEGLRTRATGLFVTAEGELERSRQKIADLQNENARKKFAPDYLREQVESERARVKQYAALQGADLANIKTRLETAANAWQTETVMRRARVVPASDKPEADLLNELRTMRFAQEFQAATVPELIDHIGEAKERGDLAALAMLRREIGRRKFDSDNDRARAKVAIDSAIQGVEIPGQKQAFALIEAARTTMESAEDVLTELQTGRETDRARMRRVMAQRPAKA
jgi:hypothetical protein